MKTKNALSVVVMALLAVAISCAAYSKEGGGAGKMSGMHKMECMGHKEMTGDMGMMEMMGDMNGMRMGMMLDDPGMQKELGLTADQKARLKKISLEEKRKAIRGEADVKILLMDLKELMDASAQNSSVIDAKIDEIAVARASLMKVKIHAMRDAKSVLTAEQHEKCMTMMMKKMGGKGMKGMKDKKAVKGEKMKSKSMK